MRRTSCSIGVKKSGKALKVDKESGSILELGNSNSEANLSHSRKWDEGQGVEIGGEIRKPSRTEGVYENKTADLWMICRLNMSALYWTSRCVISSFSSFLIFWKLVTAPKGH